MSSNKYSRNTTITKNSEEEDPDFWLKQLEKKLETTAVQSKRIDQDIYEQINSIMNGSRSKYNSVSDAVEEMKQRSGLNAYLTSMNKKDDNKKTASDEKLPKLIQEYPNIVKTIENMLEHKAYLPTPAFIENLKKMHMNDISDLKYFDDNDFIIYIDNLRSKKLQDKLHQIEDYSNLGQEDVQNTQDVDPSNNDAFSVLMPAKN